MKIQCIGNSPLTAKPCDIARIYIFTTDGLAQAISDKNILHQRNTHAKISAYCHCEAIMVASLEQYVDDDNPLSRVIVRRCSKRINNAITRLGWDETSCRAYIVFTNRYTKMWRDVKGILTDEKLI